MSTTLFPEIAETRKKAPAVLPPRIVERDPFRVEGPAYVSFSGGRTSGYMLRRVLGAGLQPDVHVLFANTGKEREETLRFVQEVSERWSVSITWLEYRAGGGTERVTFGTASRDGEPFSALIRDKSALPNRTMRFCTEELKVRRFHDWMSSVGYDAWTSVVGIRADEPRRVAKISGRKQDPREDTLLPLYHAGVTQPDVLEFWRHQPFDLQLPAEESNCDLCFLKGAGIRYQAMLREPDRAEWWLRQERETGREWINPQGGRPSYVQLHSLAVNQVPLAFPGDELEPGFDCFCGD